MTNRVPSLTPVLCPGTTLLGSRPKWRQLVLIGAIAPVGLILAPAAFAADRVVPPSFTINSDTGAPVFKEGLQEGFVSGAANATDVNPFNSSPELTLRMGQSTATGADAWADNRTWIYTGQVFTGPNGILSIAANNDDFDWFKINGVVVLNDNTWNIPNATVVQGLPVNTWVDFEYRVGNGGGGAGPSGQAGANWNNTTGVVFSYDDELGSVDALEYNLGRPTETLGGGPTLFRYQSGLGFDDDLRLTASGTLTIDGDTPLVTEPSLRLENAAAATLTVNDGSGAHKTLALSNGLTLATNTAPTTIAGTSDVRPGKITDGSLTGVRLIAGGPGQLIIDNVDTTNPNDLNGTTLEAGAGGRLTIRGNNNLSPVSGLTTPLTISGAGGVINIGSAAAGQTYNNTFAINESGTLEHTTNTADTIGSLSRAINIAAGKTLTVRNTANVLTVASNINGGSLTSNGTDLVKYTGNLTLDTLTNAAGTAQVRGSATVTNLNVTGGRLELRGDYSFTNVPAISNGGTLSLLNIQNIGTIPATIPVPSGNLEFVPGALGSSSVTLTGGTITLTPGVNGLNGNYYNLAPNSTGTQNADFFTYESYTTFFSGQVPTVPNVLTSAGDTEVLSFNSDGADTPMYSRYGFTPNNNIISRMDGKINILVAGNYSFTTRSDDGSVLFIDGKKVVDNNFYQGMTPRSGTMFLSAGIHDIDIGFYEATGGNGLEVFWQGPGISNQLLSNSVLFPNVTATFDNPVDVQQDSTISAVASNAVLTSLTVQPTKTLTTTGGKLTATTLTLNGAGNYTINTAAGNTFTANDIASNGAAVNITKTGAGVFAIDDLTTTTPQLPVNSTINVTDGALGVLLGTTTNPLGSATLSFNGGGVVLSSKNGDQSYAIPTFNGNGSIEARQIASGVAGTAVAPINITLTGNLNVGTNQSLTLGTADNYVLKVGGTATGAGKVIINGGSVIDTSGTGLQNLNVSLNAGGRAANLEIKSNAVTLGSLGSDGLSKANVTLGTGGAVTLTFTGSGSGRFVGDLVTAGATPLTVVKNGPGSQSIIVPLGSATPTNISAVSVNAGTLELSPAALGASPVTLSGGTLQMIQSGLTLQVWDTDPNATGAYGNTLDTFAGVKSHYAGLIAPAFTGNTAADGNMVISYDPAGTDTVAMFGIHGYTDLDTIEALFTGKIFIAAAGDYKFSPRSDDGSTVYIDGKPVSLNNIAQGINEANQSPRDGTVTLTPGYHDIMMTFNEGGGGQGLFVDITGPDGLRRTLSNTELFTTDVTANNAVNLTTSSGVDARGGRMALGPLTWTAGTTLTSVSGTTAFASTTLPGAGIYTIAGAGSVEPGVVTTTGGAAVTLNNAGTGSLILNNTASAQLQNSNSVVSATGGGRVVAVLDSSAGTSNPLGSAKVILGGANGSGELVLSNKTAADFSVTPTSLQIDGNAGIAADNAGGGAVSGTAGTPIVATLTNAVPYGANTLTLRSGSNYNLQLGGEVTGTGPLNVTGGSVTTTAALSAGAVNVTGGRLTTTGSLTAASASIGNGAALRIASTANVAGGTTVNAGGTLEVSGASYTGGNISLNGGSLEAVGGVSNLSNVVVDGAALTTTPNTLTARLYPNFTRPVGGFGTDQGLLNTLTEKAAFTTTLGSQDLNFGPLSAGDGAIAAYFGTNPSNTGAFTMTFTGFFTAKETGLHSFKESIIDDNAAFWVDLNQNGLFEVNGSAGTEKLATQGCCGPNADATISVGSSVSLEAGKSYRVAYVVEDTGGGGSGAARISTPSLAEAFVNPGTQTGFWSAEAGGGTLRVAGDSELTLGVVNNITSAIFTGATGTLRFSNNTARATTIGLIRSDTTFGSNTLELGANDTLNTGLLVVNDGSIISKTGNGTLIAASIGLASNSTLEVNAGRALVSGAGVGTGTMLAKGTGTAVINGSIAGTLAAETGGTIGGTGTVGILELRAGGILSPGDNGVGNLRTGDLNLNGGTFDMQILALNNYDKVTASQAVNLLTDVVLSITLGYDPVDNANEQFTLVDNAGLSPVSTTGFFTFGGKTLTEKTSFVVGTQMFQISYVGGDGNDVVITAIPEPATAATLLGAIGTLVGMQRFRRRQA